MQPIAPGKEGETTHRGGFWSRNGRFVYYSSDWNSEFRTLRRLEVASGTEQELTRDIRWDVSDMELSADDSLLGLFLNEEGSSQPYILDTQTDILRRLPSAGSGSNVDLWFHPVNRRLAWTHAAADGMESVMGYDGDSGRTVFWTSVRDGGDRQPQPRHIRYPTFDLVDGKPRLIPAWFWEAESLDGKPTPVLISVHGGPEDQSHPVHPAAGLLASRGISELQPNIRGSAGYGKTYGSLDDGRRRTDALQDIRALLDWIRTQPSLDNRRVAIYGASYGGFIALASAVRFSDRLACAIDFLRSQRLFECDSGHQRRYAGLGAH